MTQLGTTVAEMICGTVKDSPNQKRLCCCIAAPQGVVRPTVVVINDTALRLYWLTPQKPNGPIVAYYLIVDGIEIDPKTAVPISYVIAGLQPYTVYQIKVCHQITVA